MMPILHKFDLPSDVHGRPAFNSSSDLNKIPNLGDYDIDENLPQSIQSKYFTVSELSSLETNLKDLSIFHTNIRSLSRHHDELTSLLSSLDKQFDVIGVSEMWHSEENPILTNINIYGYQFFHTKSLSQNGGVGLFVKSTLCSNDRDDLNCQCEEFETIWIEIDTKKR
ncbi:MAG: endonuclease/exonuclease/phosphatase family protein [Flavobacteriaceae bacterium]|nr:endonuclease/exonuclease/phosphatase family protein [Flavobacteriaceae bacterium]